MHPWVFVTVSVEWYLSGSSIKWALWGTGYMYAVLKYNSLHKL